MASSVLRTIRAIVPCQTSAFFAASLILDSYRNTVFPMTCPVFSTSHKPTRGMSPKSPFAADGDVLSFWAWHTCCGFVPSRQKPVTLRDDGGDSLNVRVRGALALSWAGGRCLRDSNKIRLCFIRVTLAESNPNLTMASGRDRQRRPFYSGNATLKNCSSADL